YYYDRAGNVVKTVPPAGVTYTSTNRLTDHPNHTFITEYAYNSLAQVVRCKTPDGGQTIFFYDAKGKLRFSQNAKQALANKYSYTKYDPLTRIVEVGEFTSGIVPTQANCNNPAYPLTGGQEITKTIYNVPVPGLTYFGGKTQRFLQNRMSYSLSDKDGNTSTLNDQVVTYYSYDPHGNVEWMIQDIPELGRNYIAYEYDLISGSVVKVKYNETYDDKFFHRYTYDSDKRIQTVETSYDGIFWEKDAAYSYYLHGPVKRAAIGHDKIQGIDYVYTINSWLKSLNGLNRVADPGGDGALLDGNMAVPRDAYAMVLGYFNNDYNNRTSLLNSGNGINLSGTNLYNGNISSWSSNNDPKAMSAAMSSGVDYSTIMTGRTFKYDQLNRITGSDFKTLSAFGAPWTNLNDYKETFSYDANGNIINLFRNGRSASLSMDNLTYHYYTETGSTYVPNLSAPASATNLTNRLAYVTDAVVSTYTNDIDNQTNTSNYTYDAIGNLTADASESITAINWNVYGKISDITKVKAGVTTVISFMYDAAGNRVYKKVTNSSSPVTGDVTTYYVKDAAGNVMGTYERKNSGSSPNYVATFALKEQPLYGSDRLGLQHREFERSIGYVSPANPTVQLTPVGVHTSSYPFIMLPLSNTTQKQLYNRDINTNSSTAIVLSGNENLQTVSGASPTITYQHGRTQAVAYDEFGNVALSLYSYSVFTSGAFTSNSSVLFVRDKTPVILSGLNNSPNGQAAFMKVPGSDNQYYFFTIGTNGKAYYHVIEASTGAMMSSNNELDANTDYGNTMALFEDRTGQGNSTLYLRRFAASTSSLALFSITEGGIAALTPTSISTAVSSSGDGEIVISPTGNKLAVVTNTSASNSEIKVYTLGANHQSLAFSASRGFAGNSKSLEFTDNDVSVFYTSRVGTTTTLLRLPVATLASAAPVTMHTQLTSTITSAVRKGVNGKMYYLNNLSGVTTSTLSMFTNPDAATTSVTSVMTTVLATGNMPMQPHLLSYSTPTTNVTSHIRELDRKEYELKDHLGNVHTTVKDYKVPFVTGSPDVAYRETFNAGTTGGFVALVSPAGTIVDNISNRMRVYGLSAGAAAQKVISLPAGAGQYLLSFDYDAGTCSTAQFDITNLTPGDGFTKGGMQITGSYNHIIKVPTGMSTLDLRFEYQDATSGKQFYIDNILVKKVDEVATLTIGTVASENFSSPSNWVPTNTLIDYSAANMKISKDPAAVGSVFSAAKSVNLLQGQMYKITFDVTSVAMGTSSLSLVYENDNNTTLLLDYNTPLKNTATGSYTYYVTPVTNSGNVMYYINNPSGSFTCNIDNFKIDNVSIAVQPMYTSVMNNMNDYYAFGSPMPGRNYVGATDYKYGMNGMEKIDEVTSNGRTYDFGDRIYDTDLARFNSGDPLSCVFPWQSPYAYALNSPITYLDDQGGGPCKPLISMISPLLKNTLSGVRSFVHSLVALIGDKPLSKRDVFEVKSNGHRGKNFTGIYNIVPGQSTFWYNDYYEYDHIQIWTTGENPTLLWESGKDDDRKKDGEFYVATGKDPQYSGKPEDISDRQLMNGGWASYQIPADYPSSVTIKVITNNLDPENYKYDFDSNRDGSKSVWNFYIRNPKASNTSSEKKEKKEKRVREKKKKKENRGSHMNVRFL
ncbi:MAG: conserved repeat domain protein, partial [Bacteroidetes bacterium]|nr:conserved repeat domain protein [Bacteroidota bacterium]